MSYRRGPDWDRVITTLVGVVLVSNFVAIIAMLTGHESIGKQIAIYTFVPCFAVMLLIYLAFMGLSR